MSKNINVTSTLTSIGAVGGIVYGLSKQKGFFITAGFAILFAVGGAALGSAYNSISNN